MRGISLYCFFVNGLRYPTYWLCPRAQLTPSRLRPSSRWRGITVTISISHKKAVSAGVKPGGRGNAIMILSRNNARQSDGKTIRAHKTSGLGRDRVPKNQLLCNITDLIGRSNYYRSLMLINVSQHTSLPDQFKISLNHQNANCNMPVVVSTVWE